MKKLFLILGGILATLVVAIVALIVFVNPNQFKPLIVEQVQTSTGQVLEIEGDLAWKFWPSLGISMGKTGLKNPEGFSEAFMVSFDHAALSIEVTPLFSQQLSIGELVLNSPKVYLETLTDGRSNLDMLTQPSDAEPDAAGQQSSESNTEESANAQQASGEQDWQISLKGIAITDAEVSQVDHQTGSSLILSPANFHLEAFSPGEWTSLQFDVAVNADDMMAKVKGETSLWLSEQLDDYGLKGLSLSGNIASPALTLNELTLAIDEFMFDKPAALNLSMAGEAAETALNFELKTNVVVPKDLTKVTLSSLNSRFDLAGATLPTGALKGSLDGEIIADLEKSILDISQLALEVNDTKLDGVLSVNFQHAFALRFDLHSPHIDVDAWLPTQSGSDAPAGNQDSTGETTTDAQGSALSVEEPDLSGLRDLDIAGKMTVDHFKAANAKLEDVTLALSVKDRQVDISSLKASLYEGSIDASMRLDARQSPATYRVKQAMSNIHIEPLLIDVAAQDTLSGRGSVDVDVSGNGLSEFALRKNVKGTIAVSLADGAVKGFNVAEMIREARATLKGDRADYVEEVKQTDFSAMSATVSLANGVASNQDLSLASPLIRVKGNGQTDLMSEDIDYLVEVAVVESSKGQGGKDIDELKDIIVPVEIEGNWTEPSFKLDIEALLKQNLQLEQKAKREIERGLDKLLGDSAENEDIKQATDKLLKGLFR